MKKPNHKYAILKRLYDTGLHLTATDFNVSNANQYLGELESQNIVTRYWVREEGITPFKLAYVSDANRESATRYLETLQNMKSKKDGVQESHH